MSEESTFPANPTQPPPRKRRRTVLSCLECRGRKLKCDRELPCARCVQSGHPQTCTYATSSDEVALNPRNPRPRKSANASNLQAQQQQRRRRESTSPGGHHRRLSREQHPSHHYEEQQQYLAQPQTQSQSQYHQQSPPATNATTGEGASTNVSTATAVLTSPRSVGEREWFKNQPRPYASSQHSSDKHLTLEETLLARVTGQLDQLQRRVKELEAVNGATAGKGGMAADVPRPRGTYFDERDFNMLLHTTRPAPLRHPLNPHTTAGVTASSPAASSDTTVDRDGRARNSIGTPGWFRDRLDQPLRSPTMTTTNPDGSSGPDHTQRPLSLSLPPITTLPQPNGGFPFMQQSRGHGYARDFGKDVRLRDYGDVNDTRRVEEPDYPGGGGGSGAKSKHLERHPSRRDHERPHRRRCMKHHYYGPSAPSNLWKEFPGLFEFLRETVLARPELRLLRVDLKRAKKTVVSKRMSVDPPDLEELLSLLPPEDVTRTLAKTYISQIESLYRIVHVPTFLRDLEDLAVSLSGGNTPASQGQPPATKVNEEFVVILLLAIANVFCFPTEAQLGIPMGIKYRFEKVVQITAACNDWLEARSYKKKGLVELQAHVLLLLARRTSEIKRKRAWTEAGELLRLAMSFGLHRDPCALDGLSAFQGEMRRRLWGTIVEIELQASLDRGFASSLQLAQCDCAPPANIDDEEFDQATEELPPSRPIEEFTRSSFLRVSAETVQLRAGLLSSINSVNAVLNYDLTLENDEKVIRAVKQIPVWYDESVSYPRSETGPCRELAQAYARLQLDQFLIYIHHPFASQLEERLEYRLSRMHSIKSCFAIIDHCNLQTDSMAIHLLRNDMFRAGLSLCYNLVPLREGMQHPVHTELLVTHLHFLEKVLEATEKRALHLGHDVQKFWAISAAVGQVQKAVLANKDDNASRKYENEFVERLLAIARKVLPAEFASQTAAPYLQQQQQQPQQQQQQPQSHSQSQQQQQLMTPSSYNVSPHHYHHHHHHHQHQESNIRSTSSASNHHHHSINGIAGGPPLLQPHPSAGSSSIGRGSSLTPGPPTPAPLSSTTTFATAPSPHPIYNSGAPFNGNGYGNSYSIGNGNDNVTNGGDADTAAAAPPPPPPPPLLGVVAGDQFMDIEGLFDPTDMSTWGLEDLFSF